MKIFNIKIFLEKKPNNLMINLMINSLLGFIMFFIRSCETNFYSVLNCNCFKYNNNSENIEANNNEMNKKQTLISMISANMNLEFICCILYGLTDIFYKKKHRKNKIKLTNDSNSNEFFGKDIIRIKNCCSFKHGNNIFLNFFKFIIYQLLTLIS